MVKTEIQMNTDSYIVIYGNVIYKVENVEYNTTDRYRVCKRDGKSVLSLPLSSVLVRDGKGVTAQIVNGLTSGVEVNSSDKKTTVVGSEDNFVEGAVVGSIVGALLF